MNYLNINTKNFSNLVNNRRNLKNAKMSSVHDQNKITWIRFSDNATNPFKYSKYSAGYALYASEDVLIQQRGHITAPTDIGVKVPSGHYGRIAPCSRFTLNNNTDIRAGVIDADYSGKIEIIIFNHSDVDIKVKKGDPIAQIIFERIFNETEKPDVIRHSDETQNEIARGSGGSGGFGSTGGFN